MTFASVRAWARQPTTIASVALLVGGLTTAIAHIFAASPYVTFGCGIVTAALTLAGVNDNSASKPVEKLIEDAAAAYVQGKLSAVLPVLLAEGPAALRAFTSPPTVVTTTVASVTTAEPPVAPAP